MIYKCKFKFSYTDMESKLRLLLGDSEIELNEAADLLNTKDKQIVSLKKEIKGYQVALSLPTSTKVCNLGEQKKSLFDVVGASNNTVSAVDWSI